MLRVELDWMWRTFLVEIKYLPLGYCNPDCCVVEVHRVQQVSCIPWSSLEGCVASLARCPHVVLSVTLKRNLSIF